MSSCYAPELPPEIVALRRTNTVKISASASNGKWVTQAEQAGKLALLAEWRAEAARDVDRVLACYPNVQDLLEDMVWEPGGGQAITASTAHRGLLFIEVARRVTGLIPLCDGEEGERMAKASATP